MNVPRSLGVLAFLAASSGVLAPDTPRWAPAEGSILVRTFHRTAELARTGLEVIQDGEEVDLEAVPHLDVSIREQVVVTDRLVSVADGHPLHLLRTFDRIESGAHYSTEGEEDRPPQDLSSALVGVPLIVTWNEEEEEYSFAPAEEEDVDPILLEHLVEDMDLRSFLPEKEVEQGDSWELPVDAWLGVIFPGGIFGHRAEGEAVDPEEIALGVARREATTGKGRATFEEIREENGGRFAVVLFETELSNYVERQVAPEGDFAQFVVAQTRGEGYAAKVEGEVLWDLTLGHVRSLTAKADIETRFVQKRTLSFAGQTIEMDSEEIHAGKESVTVKVESE